MVVTQSHILHFLAGVVGGMLVAASAITLVWFFFLRKKKPTKLKKLKLERKLNQTEVSLLSPGPLSPPKITRVSSARAYQQRSVSPNAIDAFRTCPRTRHIAN